jgi:hypothetical protein
MPWQLKNLRLTLFLTGAAGEGAIPSWAALTARDPESQLVRAGVAQEDGAFEAGRLTVLNHSGRRLDLVYSEIQEKRERTDGEYLGDPEVAKTAFVPLALRALNAPAVHRIAYGCAYLQPVASHEQAYAFLLDRIRTAPFDLDGAKEFTYQINRPRKSKVVAELVLNRLAKWWALHEVLLTVTPAQSSATRQDRGFAAQLDTDISTDEERFDVLPRDTLAPLLEELIAASDELSVRGDVR